MSQTIPAHGTWARYLGCQSRPACRCDACVRGARRTRKAGELRRISGICGHSDTAVVAAHLRSLVAAGRSFEGISRESGVGLTTIRNAFNQKSPTMWTSNAEKLMAVQAAPDPTALIDATGSIRRMRALVAMGHDQRTLADGIPCAYTYISMLTHMRKKQVTVATAQAVERLYGRLSMTVGPSERSRRNAVRYGWDGPLAWDDDTIDDPNAVPQTDALEPAPTAGENVASRFLMGESVVLDRTARLEVLAHLMEWTNDTVEEIAARLEMSPDAAGQAWNRIKRRAKEQGGKVPWRRVYVPRRELNRQEMESAA